MALDHTHIGSTYKNWFSSQFVSSSFLIENKLKRKIKISFSTVFSDQIIKNQIKISAKMNDTDVSKQIQQMVRFIRQEAEEKANEISVSAEEVLQFSFLFGL